MVQQSNSTSLSGALTQLFQETLRALPPPHMTADVYETADGAAYVVEVPVPGVRPEDIEIDADSMTVKIAVSPRAATNGSDRRYLQRENPNEPTSRLIEFPVEIDADNIQVSLQSGMLKMVVPKATATRRRVIRVQ